MLINRSHTPWAFGVLLATVCAAGLYVVSIHPELMPGLPISSRSPEVGGVGSSPVGLAFGIVSALIFVFAAALGLRRKRRTWPLGSATTWMRAHIWLTVFTIPLILFHSGFRMGGPMTQTLVAVYVFVMLSGLVGLGLQQYLPRLMKERLSHEVIFEQIPHLLLQAYERLLVLRLYLNGRKGVQTRFMATLSDDLLALNGAAQPAKHGIESAVGRIDASLQRVADSTAQTSLRARIESDWQRVDREHSTALLDFVAQRLTPYVDAAGDREGDDHDQAVDIRETLENLISVSVLERFLDDEVLPYFAEGCVARTYRPVLEEQRDGCESLLRLRENLDALARERSAPAVQRKSAAVFAKFIQKTALPYILGSEENALADPSKGDRLLSQIKERAPGFESDVKMIAGQVTNRRWRDSEARRHHQGAAAAHRRLGNASTAEGLFRMLKAKVSPAFLQEVGLLEDLVKKHRSMDEQRKLQHRLHYWLLAHIPASFILLLLTAWHVVATLFYY